MTEQPPKPDITKDKLFILAGASAIVPTERIFMVGRHVKTVTYFGSTPKGQWPREKHFRVTLTPHAGTVEELVNLYREQLTRVFNYIALTPNEGDEQPVIPTTGEPSLRKTTEAIDKMLEGTTAACFPLVQCSPDQYDEFLAYRYAKGEPKPTQSSFEVDRLQCLVSDYHAYRYPDAESDNAVPPVGKKKIQALIDALTKLRDETSRD